jgi:hypothetical protein
MIQYQNNAFICLGDALLQSDVQGIQRGKPSDNSVCVEQFVVGVSLKDAQG